MDAQTQLITTTIPYAHQAEALNKCFGKPTYALFMEAGTGKSKIIIDETVNLIERDMINCVIILAPNMVHVNWAEQFEIHGPKDYDKWMIQVYKSGGGSKQEQVTRDIIKSGRVLVLLMNIEALSHKSGTDYLYRVMRARNRTYMCIDESHRIKSNSAMRTKMAIQLGQYAKYRRIATGTEAEEGLINLYSQYKFLDWKIIGFKFITPFKGMYCVMGGYEMRQVIGYRNQQMLAEKIAPYTYSKRKKDCLDLPEKVYVKHHIELVKKQEELYDTMEEELLIELENGKIVSAELAITRIMRLQQILCGHIDNEVIESNRAKYVAELVEDAAGKSIVFCRFVKDVELVCQQLAMNQIGCIGITGDTKDRMDEIGRWRNHPDTRALVMTIQTGGVGLTLTESSNVIYYSNSWSATDRLQSEDRVHRISQVNKVTYHDIYTKGKVDELILKTLKSKYNLAAKFRVLLAGAAPGETIRDLLKGEFQ